MDNLPPPPPLATTTTTKTVIPPPPPPLHTLTAVKVPPHPPFPPPTSAATNNLPPSTTPQPITTLPPPPPQPIGNQSLPSPTLSAAVDHLTSLLELTTTALDSLPTTLTTAHTKPPTALPCLHDPSHLIPHPSVFSHYLNCHSAVEIPQINPTTSNFFYQNCPSAVTLQSNRPTLNLALPPALLNECDNASIQQNPLRNHYPHFPNLFLPSEIWFVRQELDSWGYGGHHSPISSSYSVLRAFTSLRHSGLSFLREWIVGRSLKYRIALDFAVADSITALVGLCLKAIVRYALGLMMSKEDVRVQLNPSFEFPLLGKVLTWFGSQLAVLYGEVNGRSFAIDIIRECVLESASQGCLFPILDRKCEDSSEIIGSEVAKNAEQECSKGETIEDNNRISFSQVEEAVAKLQERAVMEEHIKAVRRSQLLTRYQRYMEHEHESKMAEEERKRRPDYKPVIEHDGLLWQRLNETDNGKTKTREELLAEERDYKRRRMSYRGKKSKRSPFEVTRDIIEEYMEAIKVAGGGVSSNAEKTEEASLVPESTNQPHYPRKAPSILHDSNRNVKREQIGDREVHRGESYTEGSKQKSHKRTRESPVRRYRDGDERRRQHSDNRRYNDGDEDTVTHRKRERFTDDRDEYKRDRNRRKSSSSKSSHSSSSHRHQPHKFEDRYDPTADSENSYEYLD